MQHRERFPASQSLKASGVAEDNLASLLYSYYSDEYEASLATPPKHFKEISFGLGLPHPLLCSA